MQAAIDSFRRSPPPIVLQLRSALEQWHESWPKLLEGLADAVASSREVWLSLARISYAYHRLDQAGWLPHDSTPFHLIEGAGDSTTAVKDALDRFYAEEWPTVSRGFSTRVDAYLIDDDAKAAFREALAVHEHGHYRASCVLLFPEVERLSRKYINPFPKNASLVELQELAGKLTPGETGGILALKHFSKLTDHLYAQVKTPEQLSKAVADPVPNRHAALHGLVTYSTMQNSINALIMVEYIFSVISAARQRDTESRT
jgi:hypothetical protein